MGSLSSDHVESDPFLEARRVSRHMDIPCMTCGTGRIQNNRQYSLVLSVLSNKIHQNTKDGSKTLRAPLIFLLL